MGMLGIDRKVCGYDMHAEHERTLVNRRSHEITANSISSKVKSPYAGNFALAFA